MNIEIERLDQSYIDEAVNLVMTAYNRERKSVPVLPEEDYLNLFKRRINHLFSSGSGVVAAEKGELLGFLAGYEIDEFFGKDGGVYCPVYGHGAVKKYQKQVYQKMYQTAADMWVNKTHITHAVTLFAHDKENINTWFWMGFGLRCVDSVRQVSLITDYDKSVRIKKAAKEDIPSLAEIHRKHHLYYRRSPVFIPNKDKDPVRDLTDWLGEDNHHLWIAYNNNKPSGYMRIQPTGESFVSEHHDIMNITGAYVSECYRNKGAGTLLLDAVQRWLQKNGFSLLGVDFESINNSGSNFWNKYFTPYTYSMVRHIDERVLCR